MVLIERRPEFRNAGVAYHRAGNPWQHVFNIQAGRMSMFREDVDDFVSWANDEADRTGWPSDWSGFAFTESGPAPRRIYADYLADRLAEAAREAQPGVTLVEAGGEVVDVVVGERDGQVVVEDFSLPHNGTAPATIRADHVIIATGLEERNLPFAAEVLEHPSFVRRAYSETGVERMFGVRQDAVVAIIGTLLTAYDAAALLLRRNHTGREPDYGRVDSTLWTNLLRRKIAVRHRRTGRGVEVDGFGTVLGPAGGPSGPISVIGGPREGDEIVRHGRMGAFSFNLAAIKNHSVGVAATVLHRLESCYDEQAGDLAATLNGHEAFARSVALDVHRMAARRRHVRETLAVRLEESLAAVRDGGMPVTDRALRFAVSTAAVRKLNDLSVTPRDLGLNLGLGTPRKLEEA